MNRLHNRQLKKGFRPFRADIQFVGDFTGRCPVLLLLPLQGIYDEKVSFFCNNKALIISLRGNYNDDLISPERAFSISLGHRPTYEVLGQNKSPERAKALDQNNENL